MSVNQVKIECAVNCNNAPKKQLLKDLTIARVKQDIAFYTDWLTDDVTWEIVGDRRLEGKDPLTKMLQNMQDRQVKELRINNIITHGNTASLNGVEIFHDQTSVGFCDVFNFTGFGKQAKIKQITSYIIEAP